jgi:hypothetical protein
MQPKVNICSILLIEENNLMKENSVVVADNVILYENEMKDYLD